MTPYGKICYVDTTAASASEIMAEFAFDEATPFQMNKSAANVIYTGIIRGYRSILISVNHFEKLLHLYQN